MSHFISVDMESLENGLKGLPLLPRVLLYLAWGATMTRNSSAMRGFSADGLFAVKEHEFTPHQMNHRVS